MLLGVVCWRPDSRRRVLAGWRALGPKALVACLAVFSTLVAPYVVALSDDAIIRPDLSESIQYSPNLLGFFIPVRDATPVYGDLFAPVATRITAGIDGAEVFQGFVPILLACISLLFARDRLVRGAGLLAAVFFIVSLGPHLNFLDQELPWSLPYAWLGQAPIFEWGRTPVRFVSIAGLFGVVVAAGGMAWIDRRLLASRRRHAVVVANVVWLVWVVAESLVPATAKVPFVPPRNCRGCCPARS
jgi:hypothetical protein